MTLTRLNPSKAGSPDRISNWLLKDYSEFLAFPITKIINASFKKQRFLPIWKITGVSPLPKIKAVEDIMLTSAFLSNLASLVAVLSPCDLPSVRRTITSRTYYRSPRWLLKICKNLVLSKSKPLTSKGVLHDEFAYNMYLFIYLYSN